MLSKDPAYFIYGPCNQRRGPHAVGHHEDLTTVKRRKLKRDKDHVARHCGGSKKKGKTKEAMERQR